MQIYLDNAATTRMSRTAIDAMLPYWDQIYGNPSSLHSAGQLAKEALESARDKIAGLLGCEPREVTFTSGGSEADNQAIVSAARLGQRKGKMQAPKYLRAKLRPKQTLANWGWKNLPQRCLQPAKTEKSLLQMLTQKGKLKKKQRSIWA